MPLNPLGAKAFAERKILKESNHHSGGEKITVERVGVGYIGNEYNSKVYYAFCKYRGTASSEYTFKNEKEATVLFDAKRQDNPVIEYS